MKKKNYNQPTMEVCELEINQPILAGSGGAVGTETDKEVDNPA